MTKRFFAVLLAFTLVLFTVIPAFAATDAAVSGTVLSIDAVAGTFQIGTEAGDTLTVTPPTGFDLTTLMVGDVLAIEGSLEESNLTATNVVPVVDDGDQEEKVNKGFFCTNAESSQPALTNLAEEYSADYTQLLDWFCSGHYGVGEIMLALRASQGNEGVSAQDLLDMRSEAGGWGKVWQELGLVGQGHNDDEVVNGGEGEDEGGEESGAQDQNGHEPAGNANGQSEEGNGNGNSGEHGNGNSDEHGNGKGQGGGHGH